MTQLVTHLRKDVGEVENPHGEALFETPTEVIKGLTNALSDSEKRNEEAWRE